MQLKTKCWWKEEKHVKVRLKREVTISDSDIAVTHQVSLNPEIKMLQRPRCGCLVANNLC